MTEGEVEILTGHRPLPAFVARPDGDGRHPAIIFYMDAPGIREELRDMARRIASHGYLVVLPDLYYRVGTLRFAPPPRSEAQYKVIFAAMDGFTNALSMEDTRAVLNWLDRHPHAAAGARGCIGFCMTGKTVMTALGTFPEEIVAGVSMYGVGIVTDEQDSPHLLAGRMRGEGYFAFAERDRHVPDNVEPTLRKALEEAGATFEIETFPDTDHGFSFYEREVYRHDAAERAWTKAFALFERKLKR